MELHNLDIAVKIAACVCGEDGIISKAEEDTILSTIKLEYPTYPLTSFYQALDDFFNKPLNIEDYSQQLLPIDGFDLFVITLCDLSASADGLDIKENIALQKVKLILGENL